VVRQELEDYREVKNKLGGTVNDVVLTVVAGALGRWLRARGVRTQGLQLRALVPVSVRTERHRNTLGNQLTAMRGPLPVYIADPVARLRYISRAMDGLKESKQAVAASTIARVNNLAPPTILAQASRLQFSTRLFNLLVTNIPGPQFPLYVLGRQLQDLFPVAFLPSHHALAVAIMSYNGGIDFGLLADYDALADLDVIVAGITESLSELLEAARGEDPAAAPRRARKAQPKRAPASIVPAASSRSKRGPAADMRAKRTRRDRGGNGDAPQDGSS
jgi:WS/DGAT/MGAT family acyltransferase